MASELCKHVAIDETFLPALARQNDPNSRNKSEALREASLRLLRTVTTAIRFTGPVLSYAVLVLFDSDIERKYRKFL